MSHLQRHVVALGVGLGLTTLLGLFQLKLLATYLTPEELGAWAAIVGLGMVLAPLVEVGLPPVLVRFGTRYHTEGRLGRLRVLHAAATGAVVVMVVLTSAGLALYLSRAGTPFELDAPSLVWVGFVAVVLGSVRAVSVSVLRGLDELRHVAWLEVAYAALLTVGLWVLSAELTLWRALFILGGANLAVALVSHAVARGRLRADPAGSAPSPATGSFLDEVRAAVGDTRSFWVAAAVTTISLSALKQLDRPLLAWVAVPLGQVALYYVAIRVYQFAERVTRVAFDTLYPAVNRKWDQGRAPELRDDLALFTKLMFVLSAGMMLVLGGLGKSVLQLLSTAEYGRAGGVLLALMVSFVLFSLQRPILMLLWTARRVWRAFFGESAWLLVYLVGGVLFLRAGYGLEAFAWCHAAASLVLLGLMIATGSRIGLPQPSVGFYIVHVLVAGVLGVTTWWMAGRIPLLGAATLLPVVAGAGLLLNAVVSWSGYFSPAEEARLLGLLRGGMRRVGEFVLNWPRGRTRSRAIGGSERG